MIITVYVHGSRDSMVETGIQMGLSGDALNMFSHAVDELEIRLEVDMTNGIANITHVDGRKVE